MIGKFVNCHWSKAHDLIQLIWSAYKPQRHVTPSSMAQCPNEMSWSALWCYIEAAKPVKRSASLLRQTLKTKSKLNFWRKVGKGKWSDHTSDDCGNPFQLRTMRLPLPSSFGARTSNPSGRVEVRNQPIWFWLGCGGRILRPESENEPVSFETHMANQKASAKGGRVVAAVCAFFFFF